MTQPNSRRAQKKLQSAKKDSVSDSDDSTPQSSAQSQSSSTSQLPTPPTSSSTSRSSSPPPQKLTRKQKRKAALAETFAKEVSTTLEAYTKQFTDARSIATPKSNAASNDSDKEDEITTSLSSLHLAPQIAMPPQTRLLICSIGNPAPYTNTLHSAGHNILTLLAPALSNPAFTKSRAHGNGLLSPGPIYTLWKSTSLMNISGTGVNAAWTTFLRESSSSECKLIVIHDELELAPGKINIKPGSNSPKGHNGLKSIRDSLRGQPYTRIGIGIGRPESRDANVVAGYVLRKISTAEKGKIEGCVGKVVEELQGMSGE